jgi:hypothetical protein
MAKNKFSKLVIEYFKGRTIVSVRKNLITLDNGATIIIGDDEIQRHNDLLDYTKPQPIHDLDQYDFECFSEEGNKMCRSLVKSVFKKIEGKLRITADDLTEMIGEEIKKVALKHKEVNDTEPESHIEYLVNHKLKEVGYGFEVSRFDF